MVFTSTRTDLVRPTRPSSSEPVLRLDKAKRWQGRGRALAFKGNALYLDNRPVGACSATSVRLGKTAYKVVLGKDARRHAAKHPAYTKLPDGDGQSISVTRGRTVVLDGAALGPPHCQEQPIRRVALYLAWRELLRPRPR